MKKTLNICGKKLRLKINAKVFKILKPCPSKKLHTKESQRADGIVSATRRLISGSRSNSKGSVSILVPDRTRPMPSLLLLKKLVTMLDGFGFKRINLIIAYGNHKKQPKPGLKLGRKMLSRVRILHHNSKDASSLARVHDGKTAARALFKRFITRKNRYASLSKDDFAKIKSSFLDGIKKPVYVNRAFLESDLKIVISDIKPHQIFGYSGGAKMILPGIADRDSIITNHLMRLDACSRLGNTLRNLPRSDSEEIAFGIKNVVYINTFSYPSANLALFSVSLKLGEWSRFVGSIRKYFEVKTSRFDTVVCAGLPPINLNLYQLTKAVTPAALCLKKGGKIIIVSHVKEKTPDIFSINERIYKLTIKRELPSSCEKIYLFSDTPCGDAKKTFYIPIDRKRFMKMVEDEKKSLLFIPDGDLAVPLVS